MRRLTPKSNRSCCCGYHFRGANRPTAVHIQSVQMPQESWVLPEQIRTGGIGGLLSSICLEASIGKPLLASDDQTNLIVRYPESGRPTWTVPRVFELLVALLTTENRYRGDALG